MRREAVERWQFPVGPLPADHPVLRCQECDGCGGWLEALPAGATALEPRYRDVACEDCEQGYVYDVPCWECGDLLLPARYGVGALLEIERDEPLFGRAPPEVYQRVREWRALCGACAWSAVVDSE